MPGDTIERDLTDIPDAVVTGEEPALSKTAKKAAANPAPAVTAILDALRSGSTDPQTLMLGALAGQGGMPPEIGALMKMFVAPPAPTDAALRDDLRAEVSAELRAEQAEVFAELSDLAERLLGENQQARDRLDMLAAGLGACPVCFGEDLLCATCNGAGRPGSRLPRPEEFNRFVSPACHRVRRELERPAQRRPWPRDPAPYPAVHPAVHPAAHPDIVGSPH